MKSIVIACIALACASAAGRAQTVTCCDFDGSCQPCPPPETRVYLENRTVEPKPQDHTPTPFTLKVPGQEPMTNAEIMEIRIGPEMLLSIRAKDGAVTYGPNYKPDKAAQEFWTAMSAEYRKMLAWKKDHTFSQPKELCYDWAWETHGEIHSKQRCFCTVSVLNDFDPIPTCTPKFPVFFPDGQFCLSHTVCSWGEGK